MRRPVWTKGKLAGKGQNGWHAFQQDMFRQRPELNQSPRDQRSAELSRSWAQADKAMWRNLARARNLEAAAADPSAAEPVKQDGAPWGIGSSEGFALARHVVANECNRVGRDAKQFHQNHNALQPEAWESFEGAPPEPSPFFPVCTVNGCEHCLPEGSRPTMESLRDLFWKVVLRHSPRTTTASGQDQEPLILALFSAETNTSFVGAVLFNTLRFAFASSSPPSLS